jgi:hypothetical protein
MQLYRTLPLNSGTWVPYQVVHASVALITFQHGRPYLDCVLPVALWSPAELSSESLSEPDLPSLAMSQLELGAMVP